jgi:hypothetical protein
VLLGLSLEPSACNGMGADSTANERLHPLAPPSPRTSSPFRRRRRGLAIRGGLRLDGAMSAEARLQSLGLTLPPAPPKGGVYKPVVIVGSLAYADPAK